MATVESRDGTQIAFQGSGQGPALVLVDGALCYRGSSPNTPLAEALAEHFTVYTYDRRGRGESGDTAPYAVEREIEDLEAIIEAAGGSAAVYGISSGAALALEAARSGLPIERLALYEAPFIVDDSRPAVPADIVPQLERLLAADRRGDAVRLFMRQVGVPGIVVALMRFLPAWSKLTAVAHTLPYDMTVVSGYQTGEPLPAQRWQALLTPTAVISGGKSPAWMRNAMEALAQTLPNAEHRSLEGQTHLVKTKALAPVLVEQLHPNASRTNVPNDPSEPRLTALADGRSQWR
jgi:pimeloyl-ACP methyl ester carboxylesterase